MRSHAAHVSLGLVLFVVGGVLVGACSIIFNTNDLPRISDAAPRPDGAFDAHVNADVNPGALSLTSVEPAAMNEGTGAANGRPVLLLVKGENIADDAKLEVVAGADAVPLGLVVGATTVSADHTMVVAPVTVPVLGSLADGAQLHLLAKVSQTGATAQTLDVKINGLDEFTSSGNVDAASLKPLYSSATFSAATTFTGSAPAHLRVTGGVTINASISADGSVTTAGPGGCAGGGSAGVGQCESGGGRNGTSGVSGASGGGGGFAELGGDGSGGATGNGKGGMKTGDDMLVTLDYDPTTAGNRGNGGGGGGGGLGNGGAGGGGGGTIEITAGGTITLTSGTIHARGGNGALGTLTGGDGGGGSGGVLLIRSAGGIMSSGVWLAAAGGTSTNGSTNGNGGAGSLGRIRVDTPTGTVTGMANTPSAKQGPMWAVGAPTVVRTAQAKLPLVGENGRSYGILVNTTLLPTPVTLTGTNQIDVNVTVVEGHNKVCTVADTNTQSAAHDVAINCIDIVFLP